MRMNAYLASGFWVGEEARVREAIARESRLRYPRRHGIISSWLAGNDVGQSIAADGRPRRSVASSAKRQQANGG